MRLGKLHLLNFKNYAEADIGFEGQIHCFLGRNGSGKTNLLEAIHYLSFTRGASSNPDAANIRQGSDHFLVRGEFEMDGKRREVNCTFGAEKKKKMAEDGKEYSKFSDHIGKYPLVIVTPSDIELIWNGGEVRRKFVDTLLSQLDKEYLDNLMVYQMHLRQRNSLLRMYTEPQSIDRELLATYDERLTEAANFLHKRRLTFINQILPWVEKHYSFLVKGVGEMPGIQYESDLDTMDMKQELISRLDRDIILGRTSVGVHRDDFKFTLQGQELRSYGSQGQQKSFLIALKLAEFDCLVTRNGFKPLLLLDDIFDKLDDERIVQLMKLVAGGSFGQIFITDARPDRTLDTLAEGGIDAQRFLIEDGILNLIP